ncbi:ATP-dependent Clp protease proteolytic subunit [Roseibacterium beibuensis]|uniref:Clp protease ClpP n=1 Tax=[Roseibacterium] beibuensis TaxID=1193142 RepID=A0ABP9LCF6_9RHOB|nr:head maturation protease, ClpP-related [Roseibacterium beibuensis]MCS6624346.1 ATP-dependent Clp protease proteolytic subunit [Roseibacterium beibuensis]
MNGTDLIQNGRIYLEGEVLLPDWLAYESPAAGFCARQLRDALAQFSGAVTIVVNSIGGHAWEGEAIRQAIADHPGEVTVIVAGVAMSAASLMIMAADRIEMTAGSILMIHDPSGFMWGTAEEHRVEAARLDTLAEAYATVYAARAGLSIEAARGVMQAETYYTAEEALAAGFCDAVIPALAANDDAAPVTRDTARARFTAMCARMRQRSNQETEAGGTPGAGRAGTAGRHQAAPAASQEAQTMPEENTPAVAAPATPPAAPAPVNPTPAPAPAADPAPAPVEQGGEGRRLTLGQPSADPDAVRMAERQRIADIRGRAAPFMAQGRLSEDDVQGAIDDGLTVAAAADRFMVQMAATETAATRGGQRAHIGRDAGDTMRAGMTGALVARMTGEAPEGPARDYMGLSIVEMAARAAGQSAPRFGSFREREEVLMAAMHTVSDFPNILGNAVNRSIEAQYATVEQTFAPISREFRFNDFRPHAVTSAGNFPGLEKISESGEIKFGTVGEGGETLALLSYARGLRISRQALVNDDLGAFDQVIETATGIVPEHEESVFWGVVTGNPNLSDGKALFHADHGNLAGSGAAITVASVAAGRAALRKMKNLDGKPIVGNGPNYIVVGPDKETEVDKLLSEIRSAKTDDVNPFAGRLMPLVTEMLTGNQWYLAVGSQKRTHAFKHGYLDGQRAPRIRVEEPFGTQGMAVTLEHDFGVGAVNHRGIYKNPGA